MIYLFSFFMVPSLFLSLVSLMHLNYLGIKDLIEQANLNQLSPIYASCVGWVVTYTCICSMLWTDICESKFYDIFLTMTLRLYTFLKCFWHIIRADHVILMYFLKEHKMRCLICLWDCMKKWLQEDPNSVRFYFSVRDAMYTDILVSYVTGAILA